MPVFNLLVIIQKLILYFSIALSLSACDSLASSIFSPLSIPQADLEYTYVLESKQKNYLVFFSPIDAQTLPINRYFDLHVHVKSAMQHNLKFPLQLDFDAGMSTHNHGMNVKPKIENLGNGHYLIKGVLLHMSGQWFFEFTLWRGVMSEKAKIDVMVVL
jgi:hypothetical protein